MPTSSLAYTHSFQYNDFNDEICFSDSVSFSISFVGLAMNLLLSDGMKSIIREFDEFDWQRLPSVIFMDMELAKKYMMSLWYTAKT